MGFPLSTRIYYTGCKHLYTIFSATSAFEEGKSAAEYLARAEKWDTLEDHLGGWLLDEAFTVLDQINLTRESFARLLDAYDIHRNYLLYHWIGKIIASAQSFTVRAPALNAGSWLYFIYAAWQHRCVQIFDTLLNEPPLRDTPWYTRYQEQSHQFQQLIALRSAERPVLEDIPVTQRAAVQAVQDDLERLAETLAQEWREAVEWATEGLPWEQLETALDRPDASPPPAYDDDSIPW